MGSNLSRLLPPLPPLPEDSLLEIFLRLPAHPAYLRRVCLASAQLRGIVLGPGFLRRFRAHHGDAPPLVGYFRNPIPRFIRTGGGGVPSGRDDDDAGAFDELPGPLRPDDDGWGILGSRHGRVLLQSPDRHSLLVVDPMAGRRQLVHTPHWYSARHLHSTAALVCDPRGVGGHGDCRSNPFRIVLVHFASLVRTEVSVYSSETGQWIPVEVPIHRAVDTIRPSVLIRDTLYWPSTGNSLIAFNVDTRRLREIPIPIDMRGDDGYARINTTVVARRGSNTSLGLVYIRRSYMLNMWVDDVVAEGAPVNWAPVRPVMLNALPPLRVAGALAFSAIPQGHPALIVGHDEDDNVLYLWTNVGIISVQMDTFMLNRVLDNFGGMPHMIFPYRSFFLPVPADGNDGGNAIGHENVVGNDGGNGVGNEHVRRWK